MLHSNTVSFILACLLFVYEHVILCKFVLMNCTSCSFSVCVCHSTQLIVLVYPLDSRASSIDV